MEVTKWQYVRDDISSLDDLDARLTHWGARGWELVTILHASETKTDKNILGPEVWMLVLKQPAP